MAGSGSAEFDSLRNHLLGNAAVRREIEFAFSSLLTAANPSDRGLRFLFGNGAEWIMAAAAWSAGILTAPAGHNANGFDLTDLLNDAKGLWSVKASASPNAGDVRLKNFMGEGTNVDWAEPTLFVGPYLRGAVLVDPQLHPTVSAKVRHGSDALLLSGRAVKSFAIENPENFIPFEVAVNKGGGSNDPFAFVKSVITPDHFPILSRPFIEANPRKTSSVVEEIQKLDALRKEGAIDDETFRKLVERVSEQSH